MYNIIEFFDSFVDDLHDATQMQALPKGDPKKVGNMFIVGMGSNNIKFGRGGTVNALIYIPHGRYSNESSGILSIIPIASSGNNEASIIAKRYLYRRQQPRQTYLYKLRRVKNGDEKQQQFRLGYGRFD
ncbi:MAG: hypothetical protein L6V85_04945 [Clostridiales bacterium]|nr:MAG: hypothetical protein L6V85_04945 [Clostridiales bacterium]